MIFERKIDELKEEGRFCVIATVVEYNPSTSLGMIGDETGLIKALFAKTGKIKEGDLIRAYGEVIREENSFTFIVFYWEKIDKALLEFYRKIKEKEKEVYKVVTYES